MNERIGAAEVRLTPDELGEINAAASRITIHGARLPQGALDQIDS